MSAKRHVSPPLKLAVAVYRVRSHDDRDGHFLFYFFHFSFYWIINQY